MTGKSVSAKGLFRDKQRIKTNMQGKNASTSPIGIHVCLSCTGWAELVRAARVPLVSAARCVTKPRSRLFEARSPESETLTSYRDV